MDRRHATYMVPLSLLGLLAGCIEPAQQVLRDTSVGPDSAQDARDDDGTTGDIATDDSTTDDIATNDIVDGASGDGAVLPHDTNGGEDGTVTPGDGTVEPEDVTPPVLTIERISPEKVSYFPGSQLREPLRFRVFADGQPTPRVTFHVETAEPRSERWRLAAQVESDDAGNVAWTPTAALLADNISGITIRFIAEDDRGVILNVDLVATSAHDLALGPRHGCLVTTTSELMCWGENGAEIPNDSSVVRPMTGEVRGGIVREPVRVPTPGPVMDVAVLGGFDGEPNGAGVVTQTTCISVRSDDVSVNGVYCAGHGSKGELGDGLAVDSNHWVRVRRNTAEGAGLLPFARELSGAGRFVCAIVDESPDVAGVWCWGRGEDGQTGGQIGDGTPVQGASTSAHAVLALSNLEGQTLEWLETGPRNVCVRRATAPGSPTVLSAGHVVCWGSDDDRQLGQAETPSTDDAPMIFANPKPPLCDRASALWGGMDPVLAFTVGPVAVGGAHICARVRTHGNDPIHLSRITDACGEDAADASVVCAGEDDDDQRGSSRSSDAASYVEVQTGALATGFDQLAAGLAFTCGIKGDGRVFCWGSNSHGQVGKSLDVFGTLHFADAVEIAGPGNGTEALFAHAIDAGPYHACVIAGPESVRTARAEVICWGMTDLGVSGGDPCGSDMNQSPCPHIPRALVLR